MDFFNLFKGKLVTPSVTPSASGKKRLIAPIDVEFLFSKDLLLLPKLPDERQKQLSLQGLKHRTKYTLIPLSKYDEPYTNDSKLQIKLATGEVWNVITTPVNEARLKLIHKKYWITKEPIATLALIATIIGIILGLLIK